MTLFSEPNELGDIELPDQPAALAVADGRAVDEHGEARVHPVEADDGRPAGVPVRRQREAPPVLPRRVAVGDVRRVDREGIGHVGVRRGAVPGRAGNAGQLPARGHRDVVEPAVVEVRGLESRGQVARATAVAELPAPVQAELADPGGLGCPRRGMTMPGAERLDVAQVRGRRPIGHAGCLSFPGGIPPSVGLERHETLVPARSNAMKVRFHGVRRAEQVSVAFGGDAAGAVTYSTTASELGTCARGCWCAKSGQCRRLSAYVIIP